MENGKIIGMLERKVFVGWIFPDNLRDSSIYIKLEQKDGKLYAHAESAEEFISYKFPALGFGMELKTRRAYSEEYNHPEHPHDYKDFISMIAEKNHGRIIERLGDDSKVVEAQFNEDYR